MLSRGSIAGVGVLLLVTLGGTAWAQPAAPQQEPAPELRESTVASSLEWLAAQQREDGSWNFNDTAGGDVGTLDDPIRATGLALLSFLNAGHTHLEGAYKVAMKDGLDYLLQHMQVEDDRGDLAYEGDLVTHAIAAQALCEAYAMTQDDGLARPAQLAINQITHTQNAETGGWGDAEGEAGNTLSMFWHLSALKCAHRAYLDVPAATVVNAAKFLDSVEQDGGAAYGFAAPGADPASTAAGLACRMYLGWKRSQPALQQGVATISELGPRPSDMQYNFCATWLLFSNGREVWDAWNEAMREWLVESQAQEGDAAGSWYFEGDAVTTAGGRLYCTSLATRILTTYRHGWHDLEDTDDFPL